MDIDPPPHGRANRSALGCSHVIAETATVIMEVLRSYPETKDALVSRSGSSPMTVQRSIEWLRSIGIDIRFRRSSMMWHLDGDVPDVSGYSLREAVLVGALTSAEALAIAAAIDRGTRGGPA